MTVRRLLMAIFLLVIAVMTLVTVQASLVRSVFDNGHLMRDPWFVATLADAYFGFLTFYVWVAYKERAAFARAIWFVLIMALGNFAMAAYVLIQLRKLQPGEPLDRLLLRT
ncbi:MAG: DUF1475 family protein [Burkholderiales bacterium]